MGDSVFYKNDGIYTQLKKKNKKNPWSSRKYYLQKAESLNWQWQAGRT